MFIGYGMLELILL